MNRAAKEHKALAEAEQEIEDKLHVSIEEIKTKIGGIINELEVFYSVVFLCIF